MFVSPIKNVITVNNSIKKVYEKKYNVPITVMRMSHINLQKTEQKKVLSASR